MAGEMFVDTSGFFALLQKEDDQHAAAARQLQEARRRSRRFVTTDYILDETGTLLKARGVKHLLRPFFDASLDSKVCRVEWTDVERFEQTRAFFLKHQDKAWSFTDCVSFVVMKSLRLREALTKDVHFRQAGFIPLLV